MIRAIPMMLSEMMLETEKKQIEAAKRIPKVSAEVLHLLESRRNPGDCVNQTISDQVLKWEENG
jgi:hypothetical protein